MGEMPPSRVVQVGLVGTHNLGGGLCCLMEWSLEGGEIQQMKEVGGDRGVVGVNILV